MSILVKSGKIAHKQIPRDLTDDQSTFAEVLAWCRQEQNHLLNPCLLSSMTQYGVTKLQWVNAIRTYWAIRCWHIEAKKGWLLTDDTFKYVFLNENVLILIEISLKYFTWGRIDNEAAPAQIMDWPRTGDKPVSEPMMALFTDTYLRHPATMSEGLTPLVYISADTVLLKAGITAFISPINRWKRNFVRWNPSDIE